MRKQELPFVIQQKDGYRCVSLSGELDFAGIDAIELEDFIQIADNKDEGYIVIPRAIGCNDYCMCLFREHREDFEHTIRELNMPVFGVKTKERCILAVVSGMTYAFELRIVLKDGIYSVYPVFNLKEGQIYEDFRIEYFELTGEDADYSGMARRYRKYRMDKGELTPLSERMKENPYVDYAVNSVMIRVRQGWKPAPPEVRHQNPENEPAMHVACDFEQVGNLLDELKTQGIEKAEICLVGWNVKGHDGRWPQAFPVCEELGGEEKLRALIKKAQSMGYQMTCHTNHTDQYEIADCFDQENSRRDRNGRVIDNAAWSGGQMYELCPKVGYEQAEKILPRVAELGFRGIHYIDVLGVVYPRNCHHKEHYLNHMQAAEYAKKMCELARKEFGGISSEGAYDFLAPYLDYGLYISFSHEKSGVCDRSIPFWQLVYHGTVLNNPYADTINPTFKDPNVLLKVIEYGGRPSYYFYSAFMGNGANWMGNTDARCDDEEQLKAAVTKIRDGYEEYRKLTAVHTAYMEKHEQVAENVYEITYSNGIIIRVDYNRKCYEVKKEGSYADKN